MAGDSDEDAKAKKFREGEKVEARYKGKSRLYPGVISRCRLNGTYDIDYDDGEKETAVAADLITSLESKRGGGGSPGGSKKLKEGDKVEAQFRGKSRFYPGVITRCRLNGTYDIDYDDGERETGVAGDLIRLKDSPSKVSGDLSDDGRKPAKKFREGEKVEAHYRGKSRLYPGVISRCRLNGTYDIDYDDGEKEKSVAAELIISKESSSRIDVKGVERPSAVRVDTSQSYQVGTRVEALYRGEDRYFKGTISRVNADGTHGIEYDDGERENRVASSLIRPLKSFSSFRGDDFAASKPVRPSPGGGARRRTGNSSD